MDITEISNLHLKSFSTSWDHYPDPHHKLDSISLEKVKNFITLVDKTRNIPIDDPPLMVLKKYKLLKEEEQITNGCYLLFAASETMISAIDIGRFTSETVIKDSLTIRTDLFNEVEAVLDALRKHINKSYIISGEAQREERWDYPMDGLREIVINMIVHRDYMSPSESTIKIFDDHIELYNPGKLQEGLTIEHLLAGNYTSTIRNKQVASLFKEAGFIERYGSGIKRILESFANYGLELPVFEELYGGFRVTVSLVAHPPQKTPQKEFLRDRILTIVFENPHISQREVAERLNISFDTAKEYFSKLKKENRLKRVGGRKTGTWVICE